MRIRSFTALCVVIAACKGPSGHRPGGDAGADAGVDATADAGDTGPGDGGMPRCDRIGHPSVPWPQVGNAPRSVVAADVNGDGVPDLVTADEGNDAVGILLGHGDGTFEPRVEYPAGVAVFKAVVADLDRDGRPDIVAADLGEDAMSVLLGNGDGTFQSRVRYPTGMAPASVAVADLDHDGILDIATPNFSDHSVSVFPGNGDGTFRARRDVPTGSAPFLLTVADVNGDGLPDLLITGGPTTATVGVLLANRDGSFQPSVEYATGSDPRQVAVADLDRDGAPDLVVADFVDNTVSVLFGNGNGTFRPRVAYATGPEPLSVAVVDLNGDGFPDLVVANNNSDTVSVLFANRDATFQPAVDQPVGHTPESVVSADLNRDGKPDLVTVNLSSNTASVLLGTGDGGFQGGVTRVLATARTLGPVLTADLDRDGKSDLIVASVLLAEVFVLLGNGDGTFRTVGDRLLGPVETVAVADTNGDGILDLITANTTGTVGVRLGKGDGTFQSEQDSPGEPTSPFLYVAELTGDAIPDLVVLDTVDNSVSIVPGHGDGTFAPPLQLAPGFKVTSVAVGDLNGDGKADLALTHVLPLLDGGAVTVLLGNGDGTFQPGTDLSGRLSQFVQVFIADPTGDGRPDLLVLEPGLLHVFAGTSSGSLVPAGDYFINTNTPLAVADANGDRIPDLLGIDAVNNTINVLLGRGDGTLQPQVHLPAGRSPRSVAVADINSDGRPDFIAINRDPGLLLLPANCLP